MPLSPGLSVPFSIQLRNYRHLLTRTDKVCLSGHTMEQILEQLMLVKCCGCAAWPGPCGYCVRNHTSPFLGKHFCFGQPRTMGLNCFPSQDLMGCRGSQASFACYPCFKVINNCHVGLCSLQISLYQKNINKNLLKEVCFNR